MGGFCQGLEKIQDQRQQGLELLLDLGGNFHDLMMIQSLVGDTGSHAGDAGNADDLHTALGGNQSFRDGGHTYGIGTHDPCHADFGGGLVVGTDEHHVHALTERDAGSIESWLTDKKLYVSSSPVDDGTGKYALTHYRTIKRANGYSLMELKLETGRKNQIRVHMSELGHPVVGDARYGSECDPLGRMALHAFKLCFYHPVTRELIEFETPYPSNFKSLMLRKQS